MKKCVIIIILFLILITRIYFKINNNKNLTEKENKIIIGTITNIVKDNDKIVVDIKEKQKYRIIIYEDVNYELGDKIKVSGVFELAKRNTVFNLFNYRKYLLSKNIIMISNNPKTTLVSKNKNLFYKIKNKMIDHINKYKTRAYLKTFLMGDKAEIKKDVLSGYENMGISHLFSISGMHLGLFLVFINFILKKLKCRNTIIFLFLSFMLFITNYTESFLRCSLFFVLKCINNKCNLKLSNMYILFITIIILFFINPYLIYSTGIWFSIIITFYIILSKKLLDNKNYFTRILIMSVVCFLASVPVLASCFFKINILSLIFNLFFVPFISIIIFPFSIITFMFPFLDSFYVLFINLLEFLTLNLDRIKLFTFAISKPSIFISILYYVFLFLSIKVNKKYLAFYLIILLFNLNSRFFITGMEVTFLDVGQADSTVIILPHGKTILIDTGGNVSNKTKIVENKTIPYLNSMGISKINLLILTHGDYDHMKESINLVNDFKVDKVVFNNGNYNDLERELIKILDNKNINYNNGFNSISINKYKLYFLNTTIYDNENDNSNVIYVNYKNYKFLFMADASSAREKDILKKYDIKDIDFLKVGHHGSDTSSSKEFIDSINPKYSFISVGKNNRYGHPKERVLNTLSNSKIYRTDLDGSIKIKLKNNGYSIKTCIP